MKNYKNMFLLLLCTATFLVSGCTSDAPDGQNSSEATSSVSATSVSTSASSGTATSVTTVVTEPVTTSGNAEADPPAAEEDASLTQLRQSMTDKEMMAVIYFGFVDYLNEKDTSAIITERAPSVCSEYSFVEDIPEERIIGGTMGDLFCIIPSDEGATVAIDRITIDENGDFAYDEVIYRSESGEPVLLYCNHGGFESDTRVNITDSQGNVFTWDPVTDDNNGVAMARDDENNDMIRDLTSYNDLLRSEYSSRKNEGWIVPTKEQLIETSWGTNDYLMDGRIVEYMLDIHEETVAVQWNDGIDAEDHRYPDAEWEYSCEDGVAFIKIDFREFAGELSYAVLLSEDGRGIYTMVDFTGDIVQPRNEKTDRYLTRSFG